MQMPSTVLAELATALSTLYLCNELFAPPSDADTVWTMSARMFGKRLLELGGKVR